MSELKEKRQKMINGMQDSLKVIRKIVDLSAQEVGGFIGVSRQTISNIENKKSPLNATQYVAICALLDREIKREENSLEQVKAVLKAHSEDSELEAIQLKNDSFLEGWFGTYDELHVDPELIKSKILDDVDLRNLCENYKLFFTNDIFENEKIQAFIFKLIPYLKDANASIIMPQAATDIIENRAVSANKEVSKKAREILDILVSLQKSGLLSVRGDVKNRDLHELLLQVITDHRDAYNIALFTENEVLAEKILEINEIKTDKTLPIVVCGVNEDGNAERRMLEQDSEEALERLNTILKQDSSSEEDCEDVECVDEIYKSCTEIDDEELEVPKTFKPIEEVIVGWDL